jgi:hypothetical protein
MKRFVATVLTLLVLLAPAMLLAPTLALATPPSMPGVSSPVYPVAFHISGQWSASKTGIVNFNTPFPIRVLYTTVMTRAKGGTQGTSTVTCKNNTNAFTDAMDISGTAGTVVEATLVAAYQSIASNTKVICDLAISGGSSPTIDDITLVIWYQRR